LSGDDAEPLEPLDFCQVMPEPFPAAGRICCDAAEGRLNAKSIILQGSQVNIQIERNDAVGCHLVAENPGELNPCCALLRIGMK
jgi:hypothetical protein